MFTDRIYSVDGADNLIFPWSRFTADPNRYEGQTTEGGIVPLRDFAMRPLYREGAEPSPEECEALLVRYHRPYHASLAAKIDRGGYSFFIDGHSMMAEAPRRSPDFGRPRPDVCISNCGDSEGNPVPGGRRLVCSPELSRFAWDRMRFWLTSISAPDAGSDRAPQGTVQLNVPFLGGHGVRTHARPERGMPGIQLELNQRLWADEDQASELPGRVEWMREVMTAFVADMIEATS